MKISTIIFDLNETVVRLNLDDPDGHYVEIFGVNKAVLWKTVSDHWSAFETGEFGQEELLRRTLDDLGLDQKLVSTALQFIYDDILLVDDIIEILTGLQGRYHLLMLAGDGEDFLNAKLDKFNLRQYFDKIYCTCYAGMRKYDPQIFQAILDDENIDPAECLYVDDIEAFVENARHLGMHVIRFRNCQQLRRELEKICIQV